MVNLSKVIIMKKKHYVLSIIFFIILIIVTYFFVLKDYPIQELINSLKNCNMIFIFIALLCVVSYSFFAALYNKRMLYHFKTKISWYQSFGYLFTEIFFSAVTPSSIGGQPVQMMEMKKDGINYQKNSIVVLLNTIIYKIGLLIIATIGFIIYFKDIMKINKFFLYLFIFGYVTTILLIILLLLLVYSKNFIPNIVHFLISIGHKLHIIKNKDKLINKFNEAMVGYQECAKFTKDHPKIFFESFIILILQRLSLLSISYFVYRSFGLNELSIVEMISFQSFITLGADFVPTPGGVAISEGLLAQINEFIYGNNYATSAIILVRGISFYLYVLFCGVFYIFFHFIKRKKIQEL